MKKLISMIALAAISFGSVFAAVPVNNTHTAIQTDTTMKKKKMKVKTDTSKTKIKMKKMKKDTTKM